MKKNLTDAQVAELAALPRLSLSFLKKSKAHSL